MEIKQNILTKNNCYKTGRALNPKMLMVHSTAVPGAPAKNFISSWNTPKPNGREVCVHGFTDDTGAYQTLPWDMQAWHCGGSGNRKAIGIELCEPKSYSDKAYFEKVIGIAIQEYAYLSQKYSIPVSNIVSHKEGHAMGIASNHGDPDHWWSYMGYTMDDFRADVQKCINSGEVNVTVGGGTAPSGGSGYDGNSIVDYLKSIGKDSSFAARKQYAAQYGITGYTGTAAQNSKLLSLMRGGSSGSSSSGSSGGYYPAFSNSSIVDGLKSIGVDSSMSNRKKIAAANGISGYTGTAAQNTKLCSLAKQGKLKKAGSSGSGSSGSSYYAKFSSASIVDGLKSIGVDSSMSNRKKIAAANGISGYTGTAAQNNKLCALAKNGKLKKA